MSEPKEILVVEDCDDGAWEVSHIISEADARELRKTIKHMHAEKIMRVRRYVPAESEANSDLR